MRYPPELVHSLAAEYVVGTLQGAARRRFETLMRLRADVRYSVWFWERLLFGLVANIEPIRPPRSLWRGIKRRIATPKRRTRWRYKPAMVTATAALAVFSFWLGTTVPIHDQTALPDRIAVFADANEQALWVVNLNVETGTLVAESSGVAPLDDGLVHELWALPEGGSPQSLGLLNVAAGSYQIQLTADLVEVVERSAALAISLEPAGGSPTGLPTGPVVHQASLVRL